jgi:hypothetical protein
LTFYFLQVSLLLVSEPEKPKPEGPAAESEADLEAIAKLTPEEYDRLANEGKLPVKAPRDVTPEDIKPENITPPDVKLD